MSYLVAMIYLFPLRVILRCIFMSQSGKPSLHSLGEAASISRSVPNMGAVREL